MRRFVLHRVIDVTGVSGTGVVAQGVQFNDGTVAVRWLGEHRSTVVWSSVRDVEAVNGHGGATRVIWLDPEPDAEPACWSCGTPPRPGLYRVPHGSTWTD